jgi:hypothetical protein
MTKAAKNATLDTRSTSSTTSSGDGSGGGGEGKSATTATTRSTAENESENQSINSLLNQSTIGRAVHAYQGKEQRERDLAFSRNLIGDPCLSPENHFTAQVGSVVGTFYLKRELQD